MKQKDTYSIAQMEEARNQLQTLFDHVWDKVGMEAYSPGSPFPVYRIRRFGEHQIVIHQMHYGAQGSGIYLNRGEGIPDYVVKMYLRCTWDGTKLAKLDYRTIPNISPAFDRLSFEVAPEPGEKDTPMHPSTLVAWVKEDK